MYAVVQERQRVIILTLVQLESEAALADPPPER